MSEVSTASSRSPLDRVRSIERGRSQATLVTYAWALGVALLLFASFAVGHLLGPTPLGAVEAALGFAGATLIGLGVARPMARRRRDRGARGRVELIEGRARRRVLLFDDYVLVDGEPILGESVHRVERAEGHVVIRYQDPVAGGPLLRELEGSPRALDRVMDALVPPS